MSIRQGWDAGRADTIQYLINVNPESIAKQDDKGNLPLHLTIDGCMSLSIIKCTYDSYPEAIFVSNGDCKTRCAVAHGLQSNKGIDWNTCTQTQLRLTLNTQYNYILHPTSTSWPH